MTETQNCLPELESYSSLYLNSTDTRYNAPNREVDSGHLYGEVRIVTSEEPIVHTLPYNFRTLKLHILNGEGAVKKLWKCQDKCLNPFLMVSHLLTQSYI